MSRTSSTHSDSLLAVRNAMKLGASLLGTWAVALGIKLVLPRYLGPHDFGVVNFAESFTGAWFILASLGIDTYVRKEIPVRPQHANDFFGSVFLLRIAIGLVLVLAMSITLIATDRTGVVLRTVLLFALGNVFFTANNTYAAILHATNDVTGVSILNVVSKLVWGGGIVIGFAIARHLEIVGLTFALSEGLRTVVLSVLARRHQALPMAWRWDALRVVLKESLPFFLVALAGAFATRLDSSMIEFLTNESEVGWFGAAKNVASLALLFTPIIGWVLLPLSSRAAARSEADLVQVTRRSIELILSLAIPVSLILALGARTSIGILFGAPYIPAVPALRVLSCMFVLTYVAMVATNTLMRLERSWYVTKVTLIAMALQTAANLVLIPIFAEHYGPGGAGLASAWCVIAAELGITTALLIGLGNRAFDRRSISRTLRALGVAAVVVLIDQALRVGAVSLELDWDLRIVGVVRLVIDAGIYVALVVLVGAVDVRELVGFVREAIAQRRGRRTSTAVASDPTAASAPTDPRAPKSPPPDRPHQSP